MTCVTNAKAAPLRMKKVVEYSGITVLVLFNHESRQR